MSEKVLKKNQEELSPEGYIEENDKNNGETKPKSGKNSLWMGIVIGVVLTIGGTHLFASENQPAETVSSAPTVETAPATAQSVTVAEVKTAQVNRSLEATGTVAAYELIPVLSQATGLQIKQILADRGDKVKAGQVLAQLDTDILVSQLAQAEASVKQAEARLAELRAGTRAEELARARENVISAEATVIEAESDLELATQRVKRNQLLGEEGAIARDYLDDILNQERSKKSNLQQAEARLREAQAQEAELQAGPRQEVILQAEAQLAQAKAQVNLVKAQLEDTQVVAPVSGLIAERNASVGDTTASSSVTPLFSIIQDGQLELRLKVPETQLPYISPGQKVTITNTELIGTVREIDPIVDENSRQATVKIDLPQDTDLKPGMFLRAAITTSVLTSLTLPMEAILPQADGSAITYLVQPDNTVSAKEVVMGEILPGEEVEILEGLKAGDMVVVKGAAYLKENDVVSIIAAQENKTVNN